MIKIKEVDYDDSVNELKIYHSKGYCYINNHVGSDYKSLKSSDSIYKIDNIKFEHYSSISKDKLISFQNLILHSYFFLYDKLEIAINKSESKKNLDEIKELISAMRKHLRHISDYINDYDNMLDNYKTT